MKPLVPRRVAGDRGGPAAVGRKQCGLGCEVACVGLWPGVGVRGVLHAPRIHVTFAPESRDRCVTVS